MTRRPGTATRVALGVALGVLLHGVAGWWAEPGLAQGTTNTTFTTSTSTSSSVESPPACSVIGSSRQEQTFSLHEQIGPGCIGIGNRDIANPTPSCSPLFGDPDPFHGTAFLVPAGTTNFNAHTHTETITCVAAVPALPWPALVGLGALLGGAGAWWTARRRMMV